MPTSQLAMPMPMSMPGIGMPAAAGRRALNRDLSRLLTTTTTTTTTTQHHHQQQQQQQQQQRQQKQQGPDEADLFASLRASLASQSDDGRLLATPVRRILEDDYAVPAPPPPSPVLSAFATG